MTSRQALYLALVLFAAASGAPSAAAESQRRPNVIVIVADDLGYADLGVHGCRDVPTPNIDSLAQGGVQCTDGYVSHPYCSPTRAGLLTGRYQQRFGHEFNPGPATDRRPGIGLPTTETTMAERFKAAGYRTGVVGKWHLGHTDEKFHPLNRGFDEFFGFLGGSHSYLRSGRGHIAIIRGREEIQEEEYLTDAFGREGAAFIERHADEPFFLYWAFNAVHGPMEADEQDRAHFANIKDEKRRTYAAMLASLDDAVGKGLAALRKAGLEQDTLIFFISDNGGPEPVNASDNGPLRGRKGDTYEGGIRVPFFVQWKGRLPAGKVYRQPVIQLDVLPTALAAAGVQAESDAALDGVNLLPHFLGQSNAAPHEALFWRDGSDMAIRMGDWKLVHSLPENRRARRAGASGVADATDASPAGSRTNLKGAELYNLAEDLGEQRDLSNEHPEQADRLAAAWQAWNAQLAEPLWRSPPRGKNAAGRQRPKRK